VTVGKQVRELAGGRGTTSQDSSTLHFGFGADAKGPLDEIRVRWPSGKESVHKGIGLDQRVTLEEP
jgi:hypothetical protein